MISTRHKCTVNFPSQYPGLFAILSSSSESPRKTGTDMCKPGYAAWRIWMLAGFCLTPGISAQSSTNVAVTFSTINSTPLNPGFAGFATEILDTGLEYGNTNFQQLVATVSPGWLRYPSGTSGDAFNWATGLTDTNWLNVIGAHGDTTPSNSCQFTYLPLLGKGGAQFTNFASLAANVGGARIIVCVNCFTDTTNSAGVFAAFALSNHIAIAAWELCNEPYLFQGTNNFFTNGTDYADKMLPYRNAIKAADSNAVVAVFFSDPPWAAKAGTRRSSITRINTGMPSAIITIPSPDSPTSPI